MPFAIASLSPRGVLMALRERRADPDPAKDKVIFDAAWSQNGGLKNTHRAFLDGAESHQIAMTKRIELDLTRARAGLDAVAHESSSYLNTSVVLLAVVSVVVSGRLDGFWQSPARLFVWMPALILILLLRVHASKLSSWIDNYEGAGAKAALSISQYAYVNSLREDVLRYNARLQRAKRLLAIIQLLYLVAIVTPCVVVTVG